MLELVDWTLSSSATEVSNFSEPLNGHLLVSGRPLSHFRSLSACRFKQCYIGAERAARLQTEIRVCT
jgi:hypothetical protein